MKFCASGALLFGTWDGASIEIAEAVGEENGTSICFPFSPVAHRPTSSYSAQYPPPAVFIFGHLTPAVEGLRRAHHFGEVQYPKQLLDVIDAIRSGMFGEAGVFSTLFEGKDHCAFPSPFSSTRGGSPKLIRLLPMTDLVSDDFLSYLEAHKMVDEAYIDQDSWIEKSSTFTLFIFSSSYITLTFLFPLVLTSARMGFFSSDRAVAQYAEGSSFSFTSYPFSLCVSSIFCSSLADPPALFSAEIWNVEPVPIPEPKR
jgi:starch phosphorylase